MNESYFEAITLVSLPMRENLRSWVAIGWKVKRKSSGQSQPRTYFCSNCGSRPLCLPWFSLVYTVGISWVFDSNDFQGYVVNANFRDNEVPRGWDQNLDWQVKMCYPFLVMMFLEWSCLKDQARYLCICEVFVSKEFACYFISFSLFNKMFKSFFSFPTVGLYFHFYSTKRADLPCMFQLLCQTCFMTSFSHLSLKYTHEFA